MPKVNMKFIFVLAVSLIFALLEGGDLPFIIFYGLFSIFISGFIYISILKYSIVAEVVAKDRIKEAGDSVNCLSIIKNHSILPVPYIAMENEVADVFNGNCKHLYNMAPGKSIRIESLMKFHQRGIYNTGKIKIRIMDVFRIFEVVKTIDCRLDIKVYPKIYDMLNIPLGGVGDYRRLLDNLIRNEDVFTVKDIRKYKQGDSLRRIHWKVSARNNELYVKNPETISGGELAIFIDMVRNNLELGERGVIEESIVDLSMSIIKHMISSGIRVSAYLNTLHPMKFDIDTVEGFNSMMEYMLIQKSDGRVDFGQYIHDNYKSVGEYTPAAVVSGKLDEALSSSVIQVKNSGLNINVFYCMKTQETVERAAALQRSGIGCFYFYSIAGWKNMEVEMVGKDAEMGFK